jgi:hypothetical protein
VCKHGCAPPEYEVPVCGAQPNYLQIILTN